MTAFWRANRVLALGGLTIISILLIIWARLGFTVQPSQFFAAAPRAPSVLTVQCGPTQNVLTWTLPAGHDSNGLIRAVMDVNQNNGAFITPTWPAEGTTFTDTDIQPGHIYTYRHKAFPELDSNAVTCSTVAPTLSPVPTTTPLAATLTATCTTPSATRATINWTVTGTQTENVLERRDNGGTITTIFQEVAPFHTFTYTDTDILLGHEYIWRVRLAPGVYSNIITIAANAQTCAVPTSTVTPSPLSCAPQSQSVSVGQPANFQVSGGVPSYGWIAPSGSPSSGTGSSFASTYDTPGNYTVRVSDHGGTNAAGIEIAFCQVVVEPTPVPACVPEGGEAGPTQECCAGLEGDTQCAPNVDICIVTCRRPTPAPRAVLAVSTTGRNFSTGGPEGTSVSALGNQQIELITTITNTSDTTNVPSPLVRAALPDGLTYVSGSTTVNNAPMSIEAVTTEGILVASIGPRQVTTVRFRVRVNGASFPAGQSQTIVVVQASSAETDDRSGSLTVFINRPTGAVPAAVPTGPGEAVVVALLLSAIATLLYVSYTNSPAFRRREADQVSADQGPMDFRS